MNEAPEPPTRASASDICAASIETARLDCLMRSRGGSVMLPGIGEQMHCFAGDRGQMYCFAGDRGADALCCRG